MPNGPRMVDFANVVVDLTTVEWPENKYQAAESILPNGLRMVDFANVVVDFRLLHFRCE